MLALEMPDEVSIRVNFNKPIPLFPLDSVVLLPQQVMPLHIFEPRYRQMVDEALDSVGQIAMAVIDKGDLPEMSEEVQGMLQGLGYAESADDDSQDPPR